MNRPELRKLVKEELKKVLKENIDYKPGGWTTDTEEPWKSLPPGTYEVTYKPMLPLDAIETYTIDLPDGKEFINYGEARSFYFVQQPRYSNIRDRMKKLLKVTKIG